MSPSILIALALTAATGQGRPKPDPATCVQDTAQQRLLERVVRDELLLSPTWARTRERWGWHASPTQVAAVTDPAVCAMASQAIIAGGGRRELFRDLVLVRAGNLYVAAPAGAGDQWIFLDSQWHVIEHVVVPS